MGLEDVFSTESAFVAAATAAVFSPRTRETMRRGAVLGVAGALKAGDVVSGAARGATRGVRGQMGSNSRGGRSRSSSSRSSSGSGSSGGGRSSSGSGSSGGGRSSGGGSSSSGGGSSSRSSRSGSGSSGR